jgi:hypothetical protein
VGGCSSDGGKKAGKATIIFSDGCLLFVDGASVAAAEEMSREWDFNDDCVVTVKAQDTRERKIPFKKAE